jgi:hypothetical protein
LAGVVAAGEVEQRGRAGSNETADRQSRDPDDLQNRGEGRRSLDPLRADEVDDRSEHDRSYAQDGNQDS